MSGPVRWRTPTGAVDGSTACERESEGAGKRGGSGHTGTILPMPERPRKRPADLNRLAASIVEDSIGEEPAEERSVASRMGERGGAKGGPARAARLSPEKRSEIARKAARARWAGG